MLTYSSLHYLFRQNLLRIFEAGVKFARKERSKWLLLGFVLVYEISI